MKKTRIAAVADLHAHKGHEREFQSLFEEVAKRADVVALCGDLTNLGLAEEAERLADDLSVIRAPIVAVLGNHDYHHGRPEEVKRVLRSARVTFLDDEVFESNGVGFAGVKGFGGGFGSHLLSAFGEEATKHFVSEAVNEALALENALNRLNTPRKVVLLHYAPILDTAKGESPEILPFIGCSRLGETIDRFNVSAVFHGHAHHGALKGKTSRGVPVYNCSLPLLKHATQAQPFVVVEI